MNRVLVTGLGVATNVGHSLDDFWSSLAAGRSSFSAPLSAPDAPMLVGAVDDAALQRDFPLAWPTALDRSAVLAVAAAARALVDAGLKRPFDDAERVGVVIGNGGGGLELVDGNPVPAGPRRKEAASVDRRPRHVQLDGERGLDGVRRQRPLLRHLEARASSAHAIGVAAFLIRAGVADVAIAGGAEAGLNSATLAAWQVMKIVSRGASARSPKDATA